MSTQTGPSPTTAQAEEITCRKPYNKPLLPKKPRTRRSLKVHLPAMLAQNTPTAEQAQLATIPATTIVAPNTNSKLTAGAIADIEEAIMLGMPIESACELGGIISETYRNWCDDNPILARRFQLIKRQAEVKCLRELDEKIDEGNRCWTGKAWKLERLFGHIARTETKSTNTNVTLTIAKQMFAKMGDAGDVDIKRVQDAHSTPTDESKP